MMMDTAGCLTVIGLALFAVWIVYSSIYTVLGLFW